MPPVQQSHAASASRPNLPHHTSNLPVLGPSAESNFSDDASRTTPQVSFVIQRIEHGGRHRRRILCGTDELLDYIAKLGPAPVDDLAAGYEDALDADVIRLPLDGKGSYALIDAEDYTLVRRYGWGLTSAGYAYARVGYSPEGDECRMPLHRLVLMLSDSDERVVDHANSDRLDNRKVNLRVCTQAQNCWNSKRPAHNTSGIKGVQRYGAGWRAVVAANGKRYAKVFGNDVAAAERWVREVREQLHGTFARHE